MSNLIRIERHAPESSVWSNQMRSPVNKSVSHSENHHTELMSTELMWWLHNPESHTGQAKLNFHSNQKFFLSSPQNNLIAIIYGKLWSCWYMADSIWSKAECKAVLSYCYFRLCLTKIFFRVSQSSLSKKSTPKICQCKAMNFSWEHIIVVGGAPI